MTESQTCTVEKEQFGSGLSMRMEENNYVARETWMMGKREVLSSAGRGAVELTCVRSVVLQPDPKPSEASNLKRCWKKPGAGVCLHNPKCSLQKYPNAFYLQFVWCAQRASKPHSKLQQWQAGIQHSLK